MDEVNGKAEFIDSAGDGHTMTATIPRSEVEVALQAEDGSVELFLDVARAAEGTAPAEVRRVTFASDHVTLERLLESSSGDAITLAFEPRELEAAFDAADVEAHGLRERALVLTVAVATAAAGASAAHGAASPASAGYQRTMPTDYAAAAASAESEGYQRTMPADYASGAAAPESAGYQRTMPGDYARSDQPAAAHETSSAKLTEDAGSRPSEFVPGVTDFPRTDMQPQQQPSGEGTGISVPEPARDAAIAGGLALLITAAGFAARSRRRVERTT